VVMVRCRSGCDAGNARIALGVLADQPPRVNQTWQPGEHAEQDVDPEVSAAPALDEDTGRWQEDREKVQQHIAVARG